MRWDRKDENGKRETEDTRLKTQDSRHKTPDMRHKTPDIRHRTLDRGREELAIDLKSSSGLSLIAVMWIVTILTVLASEFIYSMQLEIRISRNWSDQTSAFYAAKGGLESAIAMLRDDETGYDSIDEDWAEEIIGELNNSTYTTTVVDESAKINVNTADEETITNAIVYIMSASSDENALLEEETTSEAQTLAASIVEKRPYRTVAEIAKATDMTPEILYGRSIDESGVETEVEATSEEDEDEEQPSSLVEIITVYSVDKNTTSDGEKRVNINSADANTIQQGINPEGQEIITQQEAQAIVNYRDEQGNNQGGGPNQEGGVPGQGGEIPAQGEDSGQTEAFQGISQLLDVPAISQQTLDSIRDRITVEDEGNEGGNGGNREQERVNINTADASELQNLDGIDSGIAESIVSYRGQNQFENVDGITEVRLISIDDMRTIVDRITISDDEVLQGKVNINTAPLDILQMLPGMDEEKAQAVINQREVAEGQSSAVTTSQQDEQETGPFSSIGQLMNVQGIDEETFRNLIDHVSYRSHAYMIKSEGRSSDGKIIQTCTAVVDRSGDRVKTKYWKQE